MGYNLMNGWGGMPFGGSFMLLFWVIAIVLLVALFRSLSGSRDRSRADDDSALNILKERYARGEIDEREYEERRRKLTE